MSVQLTRWVSQVWSRCANATCRQQRVPRAHFERLEPRTVLSASYATSIGYYSSANLAHADYTTDNGVQPAAFASVRSNTGMEAAWQETRNISDEPLWPEDRKANISVVATSSVSGASRREVFRNALPPPPLSLTVYSSSSFVLVITFPEDPHRRPSEAFTISTQPPRAPQPAHHPAGSPTSKPNYDSVNGAVSLQNLRGGAALFGLTTAPAQVEGDATAPKLARTARDSVFEDYDTERLLLATSSSTMLEQGVDGPAAELITAQAGETDELVRLGGIATIRQGELTESRLATQRDAIDEVMLSLHDIDDLISDSTDGPQSDFDRELALDVCVAANRLHTDGQSGLFTSNGAEDGMVLLAATGDANEGVFELAVVDMDATQQLEGAPTSVYQTIEGFAENGWSNDSGEPSTHGEPLTTQEAEQPIAVEKSPPSQRAAMVVGTGVVLGAMRWGRKKRALDQKHRE